MTTEEKAMALVNEVARELNWDETKEIFAEGYTRNEALFRAIEQHEAFRQEVSDAVVEYFGPKDLDVILAGHLLERFIIPAPKPDPLVEVIDAWFNDFRQEVSDAASFRTALEAYGLEIRKKNA